MAELRFRVYYGNGATFEGAGREDAWKTPQLGVQVIAQQADNRQDFILLHSKDAYVWREDGGWHGVNDMGFWEYLFLTPGPKQVIFGRTLAHTPDFHACVRRAGLEGLG